MLLSQLRQRVDSVLSAWCTEQGVPLPDYSLEEPPAGVGGDLACNIAMLLSKPLKSSPRAIAEKIKTVLEKELTADVQAVSIAGPGFINLDLKLERLVSVVSKVLSDRTYGALTTGPKEKIMIEFVSANPTGPLHVGHGRGAAMGDSMAKIFAHLGHSVTREYYINDAGNQVELLGKSLQARCFEILGQPFQMPEEGYHGDYIKDVAAAYLKRPDHPLDDVSVLTRFALDTLLEVIKNDLKDFGVEFNSWFSEVTVVQKGLVDKHMERLRKAGHIEDAEGAIWFVAPGEEETRDKNRVLKRKDGRWTYFATDIAYHADKYERGYDRLVNLWGADHHGYVARVKGAMQALGYDASKLHIVLYQLVSLLRGGKPVSMSKRSGDFITMRDVLDEVGRDACRFFFAMRGPNTALDFDLELAKQQSSENPVYYAQYAHARICSIFRQAGSPAPAKDLSLLKEKEERDLMKRLAFFPSILDVCAREDSPHPLSTYVITLCRQFHYFYDHHKVLGQAPELTAARLDLLSAVRTILAKSLELLGVSAPEQM